MATQAELDDARTKYHRLMTGTLRVMIQKDGVRTEFTPADASKLSAYIEQLQSALGQDPLSRRRPARVI